VIAVDSSAIIAILYHEEEETRLRAALEASNGALISTCSVLEVQLVVAGSRSRAGWREVEVVFAEYAIAPHTFNERQLAIARDAVIRFGKGRHKAGLNFGDCFAYALAKSEGIPLLCTGSDFAATDVEMV
jgi:ribonuclease VapC